MLKSTSLVVSLSKSRVIQQNTWRLSQRVSGSAKQSVWRQSCMGLTQTKEVSSSTKMSGIQEKINNEIKSNTGVLVYSKSYCPYCNKLKEVLRAGQVEATVHEIDLDSNTNELQQAVMAVSGQWTVPNVFIGSTHIGGFSEFSAGLKDGSVVKELDAFGIPHAFK